MILQCVAEAIIDIFGQVCALSRCSRVLTVNSPTAQHELGLVELGQGDARGGAQRRALDALHLAANTRHGVRQLAIV